MYKIISKYKENALKNTKNGALSIEMVFSIMMLLMVFLLLIGFYSYTYPRSVLEKEVHILAQQAKVTGGLTQQQISDFKNTLSEYGFTAEINAYTTDGSGGSVTVLNVAPRNTPHSECTNLAIYTPFVKRDSGAKIIIDVRISAEDGLIAGPLAWFGAQMLPENYILTETILSERNRC